MPWAWISLTTSRYPSQSFVASGTPLGLHPVSTQSCCMEVRASCPAFSRLCEGVHRSKSLLQQCPASNLHLFLYILSGETYLLSKEKTHTETHTLTSTRLCVCVCVCVCVRVCVCVCVLVLFSLLHFATVIVWNILQQSSFEATQFFLSSLGTLSSMPDLRDPLFNILGTRSQLIKQICAVAAFSCLIVVGQ